MKNLLVLLLSFVSLGMSSGIHEECLYEDDIKQYIEDEANIPVTILMTDEHFLTISLTFHNKDEDLYMDYITIRRKTYEITRIRELKDDLTTNVDLPSPIPLGWIDLNINVNKKEVHVTPHVDKIVTEFSVQQIIVASKYKSSCRAEQNTMLYVTIGLSITITIIAMLMIIILILIKNKYIFIQFKTKSKSKDAEPDAEIEEKVPLGNSTQNQVDLNRKKNTPIVLEIDERDQLLKSNQGEENGRLDSSKQLKENNEESITSDRKIIRYNSNVQNMISDIEENKESTKPDGFVKSEGYQQHEEENGLCCGPRKEDKEKTNIIPAKEVSISYSPEKKTKLNTSVQDKISNIEQNKCAIPLEEYDILDTSVQGIVSKIEINNIK